ncbi:AraC family transcriptional regulator [Paenibacillus sp. FSL W8-1187]|uniref:AraC family transcriptional regulator n=1 Tax=Paenibacillus sp. FSL W8-1187 TaxID=2975339 RepID=UPI0030DB2150
MASFTLQRQPDGVADPELNLLFWGREQCCPGHTYGPGMRDFYKIHFIQSGSGTLTAAGETHRIGAGQAFLTYPHMRVTYSASEETPWLYSWIAFKGSRAEELLARTALSAASPIFPLDDKLMPTLDQTMSRDALASDAADLLLLGRLYEFLAALIAIVPRHEAGHDGRSRPNPHVADCLRYLHAHYDEDISVESMAREFQLDRKYLSSLFKRETGMPPRQYLLDYRMSRAADLLDRTDCTVSEIAFSVGYRDPLLFSRMFKRVRGCSPRSYRDRRI